ncbi:MAG: hypothetical protein BWK75_02000 [Candidatus Altiarchaeales archaeon A3]|nr:MAG: hypothetical protein BWK75_02000 [Candidatus Altiarchaeales archaeon A3]
MATKCNKGECEYNHEGCCIDNFKSCAKNKNKKLITEEEYDEMQRKKEKKEKTMVTKCNREGCYFYHEGCCTENFNDCDAKNKNKKLITEEEYDEMQRKKEKKMKNKKLNLKEKYENFI